MNKSLFFVCLLLCLLVLPTGIAATYQLSTGSMVDIPDRDRSFDGREYEITHISRVEQGEMLSVDTNGPDDRYDVNLISPEGQFVRIREVREGGESTVRFDMSRTPGSWLITITDPNSVVAIHPVIIKGYDITTGVEAETIERGTTVTAKFTLTEPTGGVDDQKEISRVEAVLAGESTTVQTTAEKVDDNTYEVAIPTGEFDTGTYELYGVIRGTKEIRGREEALGLSDVTEVTIEPEATATSTQTRTQTPTAVPTTPEDTTESQDNVNADPGGTDSSTGASDGKTIDRPRTTEPPAVTSTPSVSNKTQKGPVILDTSLNNSALDVGETATVDTRAHNPSNKTRQYMLEFTIGTTSINRTVTLQANETTTVSQTVQHQVTEQNQTDDVYVNGKYVGTIAMIANTTAPTTTPFPTTTLTSTPSSDTSTSIATRTSAQTAVGPNDTTGSRSSATSTESSVITPQKSQTAQPREKTTTASGDGFGIFTLVIALIGVIVCLYRRN